MTEFKKAGTPVEYTQVKEGTYLSGSSLAMMNKSPHPNAARIFVNWFLTRGGQNMMQISTGSQSARVDTTTEGLEASSTRVPGVKYFAGANSVEELVLKEQGRYFEIVRELFRPLSGQ